MVRASLISHLRDVRPFCWFCFPQRTLSTYNTITSLKVKVLKLELFKQAQNPNASPQMRKSRYLRGDTAQISQTSLKSNEKYRGLYKSAFKIRKDGKKLGGHQNHFVYKTRSGFPTNINCYYLFFSLWAPLYVHSGCCGAEVHGDSTVTAAGNSCPCTEERLPPAACHCDTAV